MNWWIPILIASHIGVYLLARYGGDALRARLDVLIDAVLGRFGFARQPQQPERPEQPPDDKPPRVQT